MTVRFVHLTDVHVGSPTSFRYAPAWVDNWRTARRQALAQEPDLILLGGDLTRDGFLHDDEFDEVRRELDTLPVPWHALPGNMDVGNKVATETGAADDVRAKDPELNLRSDRLRSYRERIGPLAWTFVHRDVRFTGLVATLVGSGLPEEAEVLEVLDALPDLPRARQHVAMTHYPLYLDDVDEPTFDLRADADSYRSWYFGIDPSPRKRILEALQASGVTAVLSGHVHARRHDRARGIDFYKGPSTAFPQSRSGWPDADSTLGFGLFEVTDAGLSYRFVPLERESRREGYGPGGHPPAELRDYGVAWGQDPELPAATDE